MYACVRVQICLEKRYLANEYSDAVGESGLGQASGVHAKNTIVSFTIVFCQTQTEFDRVFFTIAFGQTQTEFELVKLKITSTLSVNSQLPFMARTRSSSSV